ncbi:MAG TPA: class I SAM-dependent methyltransferase family protein [Candidatus Methanoperedenaceae archaeon]|nr:class I SAM-dependent methyltransferase family protein [Candidatus Methanoperedenaceae archaeon]
MKLCARVPKNSGETVRRYLLSLNALDSGFSIGRDEQYLYIPIIRQLTDEELAIGGAKLTECETEPVQKKASLEDILGFQPSYETIGSIAIIDALDMNAKQIAEALLTLKHVKTVLGAATPVTGEYRTRELVVLAGELNTETIYIENGCRYKLDLSQVYFSPRLSTERMRVAAQVKDREKVFDMFAGVGPFSILIAKRSPDSHVIASDKNPVAIKYLKENARLNRLSNVEVLEGDAHEVAKTVENADRILMNLPHSAHEFLGSALRSLRDRGTIHFYAIAPDDDPFSATIGMLRAAALENGFDIQVANTHIVRSYSPHRYNTCIDFSAWRL